MELEFSNKGSSLGNSRTNLVGKSQSMQRFKPIPVTVSGISIVSTAWLIGGFIVVAALLAIAGFPYWVTISSPSSEIASKNVKIGLFYFCYTPDNSVAPDEPEHCSAYIWPEFKPSNLSSIAVVDTVDVAYLLTSSICYGFGTGLLLISLFVGVLAYCKPRIKENSVFLAAFVIQLFGCIFLFAAMVIYPLMFHSDFVRQFCGSSADYYMKGRCSIDWSTMVAMVTACLSFYLPPFAIFSMNVSDGLKAYNCC